MIQAEKICMDWSHSWDTSFSFRVKQAGAAYDNVSCPRANGYLRSRRSFGYATFNFRSCGRRFSERTGMPLNDLQHPTDIVLLMVESRL